MTTTTTDESHKRGMRIHALLQGPVLDLVKLLEEQADEHKAARGSRMNPTRTPLPGSEIGATVEQYEGVLEAEKRKVARMLQDAYRMYYDADDVACSECSVEV